MSKIGKLRQRLGAVGLKKKKGKYTGLFDDPAIYRSIKLRDPKLDRRGTGRETWYEKQDRVERGLSRDLEGVFSQKWLGKDKPIVGMDVYIPFDYEKARKTPVAPLQKEVPFGKENRTKKQIMEDVEDEQYGRQSGPITEALESCNTPSGCKNIGRSDRGLIYPKKPTQKERTRIIQAKQRLARIYES